MKKLVVAFGIGVWCWTGPCFIFAQARRPPLPMEAFSAVVDGRIRVGWATVMVENVPCLSLQDIQRLFGGRQRWQRVSRKVIYELGGRETAFTLDSSTVTVAGTDVPAEIPVRWWSGQVYVPLTLLTSSEFQRFAETSVRWDSTAHVLTLDPVPSVSSPRFFSYPGKSRVVLELGPRVNYRVMSERNGVLQIQLFGGRSVGRESLEVQDGLVESVELTSGKRSCRLTLTLAREAASSQIKLEESPRRLVVEVLPGRDSFEPSSDSDMLKPLPPEAAAPIFDMAEEEGTDADEALPPPVASPLLALSPIKTIVIDPGHGGKDAGASGPHGTLEKNINLEIGKALARVLKRERRFKVIMTRQDDTFIPLEERADIANKQKADLFISIHCNAAFSKSSNGFEIYFLSEKATDDAAAAVARRENAVVELEGITGKTKLKVQELLWSLARTETMNESSEIAALMGRQVDRRLRVSNRGVKQAGFYVLKGANMPAVLVESAFITHPREEGTLRSKRFQSKLADALYAGVLDYEKRKIQARMTTRANAPETTPTK